MSLVVGGSVIYLYTSGMKWVTSFHRYMTLLRLSYKATFGSETITGTLYRIVFPIVVERVAVLRKTCS